MDDTDWLRFSPPDLSRKNPGEAAHVARQWLGLGDRNTFDTYREAVEAQCVLVFRSNGYNGKWQIAKDSPILGFTLYDANYPVIVVKKQWESRQTFALMHELGHLLLHKANSIDDEHDFESHQGREREANRASSVGRCDKALSRNLVRSHGTAPLPSQGTLCGAQIRYLVHSSTKGLARLWSTAGF